MAVGGGMTRVDVGVGRGVGVNVDVGVGLAVKVGVGVGVDVGVNVNVGVGLGLGVGVGVAHPSDVWSLATTSDFPSVNKPSGQMLSDVPRNRTMRTKKETTATVRSARQPSVKRCDLVKTVSPD